MKIEFTAIKTESGSLEYDRDELKQRLRKIKVGVVNIMIADEKLPDELKHRSNAENAYYWGVVCRHAAACFAESEGKSCTNDDAHTRLKEQCNGETVKQINQRTGEIKYVLVGRSTKDMSTIKFEEYLAECRMFLNDWYDVYVPLPNEPPPQYI